MKDMVKGLMISEGIAILMGSVFTFLSLLNQKINGKMNNHDGECDYDSGILLGWIMLFLVRGPLLSVFLPALFTEPASESSQNAGKWARLRTAFKDDRIITGVSAVFTLAVMAFAFEIFSRFIVETYKSDPQRNSSGVIDCSGSAVAQFTGQAIISALGPLSFLSVRAGGKSIFKCLQQRSRDRLVERRSLVLNANVDEPGSRYSTFKL